MLLLMQIGVMGCAPVLDWREVRPAGSGVSLLFPCKPDSQSRLVRLAGMQVRLVLLACAAGGSTWGLAHADVVDPASVGLHWQNCALLRRPICRRRPCSSCR